MTTATTEAEATHIVTPEGFQERQRELLERQITVWPARAWYLFDSGHPCDRFKVWRWTLFEAQRPHDVTLQSIFGEGHLHQPDVYNKLEAMGFELVRESDRPRQWKLRSGAVISGRVDGRIKGYQGVKFDPTWLLEVKSCSPHTWETINRAEDILRAREHYIRQYWDQGQLGAMLEDCEHGLFVLKNKLTGLLKAIPYSLDYAYCEKIVTRIERLAVMVQNKIDPPPIPYEPSVCDRCGFHYLCWPIRDEGEGAVLIQDGQFADELAEWDRLKPAASEYDKVDKLVKAKAKKQIAPNGTGLCGGYSITLSEKPVAAESAPRPARVDTVVRIKKL